MTHVETSTSLDPDDGVRLVRVDAGPPCDAVTATVRAHVLGVHQGPPLRVFQRREGARCERTYHPGQLTFIPAGMTLSCTTTAPTSLLQVHFGRAFVARTLPELPAALPERLVFEDGLSAELARSMAPVLERQAGAGRLYVESAAVVLWARLAQRPERSRAPGLSPRALSRVTELMRAKLGAELGVAELAEAAGLSARHLGRMFKRSTGMTPHRYLHQLRLETAKLRLSSSKRPITEIALEVGFASASHFAAAFARATGVTPQRYRASTATPAPVTRASPLAVDRSGR